MELTILILLLPFFSFLILGIGGKWMSHRTAGTIGTLILGAVAVLSYVTAFQYFSAPRLEDGTFATLMPYNFTWLPFTETLHFDLGILLDPISVMMLIVISTVSLMVHIYSFGYMKGEVGFQRYYAFLSLFTMSMLGLVVALKITKADVHVETGWCNDYLIFDSEPLIDVIEQIERWYGVEIELKYPQIAQDLLSGSFRHENIQNVIHSLSLQYKFKYEIHKDKIIIY